MNTNPKYGKWSKDPNVVRDWTKADYFINNNEIYYSLARQNPVGKLTGRKSLGIRYLLYALFYLYEDNNKKTFRFDEVYKMAKKKDLFIKRNILLKGQNQIIPQAWYWRHKRSNGSFDVNSKIQETIMHFKQELSKKKITTETLYIGLAWLSGTFVDIVKTKKKDEDKYIYYNSFDKNGGDEYITLSRDGKELLEKYKNQNYII